MSGSPSPHLRVLQPAQAFRVWAWGPTTAQEPNPAPSGVPALQDGCTHPGSRLQGQSWAVGTETPTPKTVPSPALYGEGFCTSALELPSVERPLWHLQTLKLPRDRGIKKLGPHFCGRVILGSRKTCLRGGRTRTCLRVSAGSSSAALTGWTDLGFLPWGVHENPNQVTHACRVPAQSPGGLQKPASRHRGRAACACGHGHGTPSPLLSPPPP